MNESTDDRWYEPNDEGWPRDAKVDEARDALLRWFDEHDDEVFYGRQLAVLLEKRFYHWITTKAVNELATEGRVKSTSCRLKWKVAERRSASTGLRSSGTGVVKPSAFVA